MTGAQRSVRAAPVALLILYTIFIGLVTLSPQQMDTGPGSFIAELLDLLASHRLTAWIDYDILEKLANVGMFVPFGFLVSLQAGRRRWWLGWVTGIAFTCLIEGAQATLLSPTRFGTISDLVTNSLGAGIGAVVGLIVMTIWPPRMDRVPVDHEVR